MSENHSKRIEFLYTAIKDSQELIRYNETKTALAITVIGAYIIGVYASLESVVSFFHQLSCLYKFSLATLILLLIICIFLTVKIILPNINPKSHTGSDISSNVDFFIGKNSYKSIGLIFGKDNRRLSKDFKVHLREVKKIKSKEIIEVLLLEHHKSSFIRNLKNDRFRVLVYIVLITGVVFFLQQILLHFEVSEIKALLGKRY